NLEEGMEMQGTVRNVVDFGAFVDIGVGQDGLVHISKLSNRFVNHPMDVVSVGDVVTVWVDEVYINLGRVDLIMIKASKYLWIFFLQVFCYLFITNLFVQQLL